MDDDVQSDFQYPFPLLIVAGKGGVGKTVLTAAIGTETANDGHSTLLVELGGQSQLLPLISEGETTESELGPPNEEGIFTIRENLSWMSISPDRLLAGWLSGRSMGLIADRLERSGALSVIATSVPGIKDVLLVGYLRRLVDLGTFDRIIVDGPASGRARELLRSPMMVAKVATEGPIYDQASRGHTLLTNADETALLLVTLPEETPVNETIETAFDAEDEPGIHLAGVVINRVFPRVGPPKSFDKHPFGESVRQRFESNAVQCERLQNELPVPQWTTPENPHGIQNPTHIAELIAGSFDLAEVDDDASADDDTDKPSNLDALDAALDAPIVVTVGTGGVGKTTLGAALAWREAAKGRSVALITIDPAKRLADALGLDELDDELREVEVPGSGTLRATMLDPGKTFERVIRAEAKDVDHANRILGSPLAGQLIDSLAGMTEYMAVERLWQLHNDPTIDLVVVDTPPSSDALAFLDAPTLLARLLDNRMYTMLVHGKRRSFVNRALSGVVGQLVSTVGGTVVRDAVDFFKSFEGVEEGFRLRGDEIHTVLRSDKASIIVVASPTGRSLGNARAFIEDLRDAGVEPSVTIANRCTAVVPRASRSKAATEIVEHLQLRRNAEIANLAEHGQHSELPLVSVNDLATPVTSLAGITELANQLNQAK